MRNYLGLRDPGIDGVPAQIANKIRRTLGQVLNRFEQQVNLEADCSRRENPVPLDITEEKRQENISPSRRDVHCFVQ
jgi:hypothetical protein